MIKPDKRNKENYVLFLLIKILGKKYFNVMGGFTLYSLLKSHTGVYYPKTKLIYKGKASWFSCSIDICLAIYN